MSFSSRMKKKKAEIGRILIKIFQISTLRILSVHLLIFIYTKKGVLKINK